MASSNSNKSAMYWILLPVGVIVILAAVFMVGKVFAGRMAKPPAPPAGQNAKVILEDQPGSDQQRADRITLGDNASTPKDDESEKSADKKNEDKKKADEKAKAEVSTETVTDTDSEAATTTAKQKTKAIITTEPDSPAGGGTAAETVPATAASHVIYRLQLGAFESEDKAKSVAAEAHSETGLTVIIGKKVVGEKTLFRLQCGAFTDKDKAQSYARELELKGLSVYVSEEKR